MDMPNLALIVAHGNTDTLGHVVDALDDRHEVLARCNSIESMKAAAAERRPDMIVTDATLPDGDAIQAAAELGDDPPLPVLIITEERSLQAVEEAIKDHVMAYIVTPFHAAELDAQVLVAYERHRQFVALQNEVRDLQVALEDRRIIERAKGALMLQKNMTEHEAYRAIQRRAQDGRTRMLLAAAHILEDLAAGQYTPQETEDD